MKLVACNSNRPLAEAMAASLGVELTNTSVRRFSDMEVFVEIQENVRGQDVFIIQSTSYPANDHLMELLICIDALQPRVGTADHARDPLLRLCPPGPQSRLPHADFGQIGGQSDHRGRRQPGFDDGSACRPDSGILSIFRSIILYAAPNFVKDIKENFNGGDLDDRLAGCGRRVPGPRNRQAA